MIIADISDCKWLFSGISWDASDERRCPTKQEILNHGISIHNSSSYANNQLVQLNDLYIDFTINIPVNVYYYNNYTESDSISITVNLRRVSNNQLIAHDSYDSSVLDPGESETTNRTFRIETEPYTYPLLLSSYRLELICGGNPEYLNQYSNIVFRDGGFVSEDSLTANVNYQ